MHQAPMSFPKPVLFALIAALSLPMSGCERTVVVRDRCQEPRAGAGLVPGERVLARFKDAFHEATVITVQGRLVTVAWDTPPPERSYLPRSWILSIERPAKVAQGQWALCRPASSWELCRIDSVQQDLIVASLTSDGQQATLRARRAFPLPAKLRGWAEEHGGELLAQARRKLVFARARPAAAGQAVKIGQRVLAEWQQDSWWEATVVKVDKAKVTVSWIDSSGEHGLQPMQVAPLETDMSGLKPESVAFCKWAGSGQWWKAWVERLSRGSAQVIYSDGSKAQVTAGQCLPATADAETDGQR